ncbi:WD40-repeat-containing domain protein [Bisporella sp. PMI_857]|nr:WD40-repeat-containing domain protein [Bisporella sp. PMI_857]
MENVRYLAAAMKDYRVKIWDLNNSELGDNVDWTEGLEEMTSRLCRRPITAAISLESQLLTLVYEGESGAYRSSQHPYGSSDVRCLRANSKFLAAAYTDGELVLFDTASGEIPERTVAFAHILISSPDGSTLATADPSGAIQRLKFKTLQLIYRIDSVELGIQGLCFSEDGEQLLDNRGSHCHVWWPTVLIRQNAVHPSKRRPTTPARSPTPTEPWITTLKSPEDPVMIPYIAYDDSAEVFFFGKEDGSLYLFDTETGLQIRILFSHAKCVTISSIVFDSINRTLLVCLTTKARLLDHQSSSVVSQAIYRPDLDRILMCSAESDTLWSISGKETDPVASTAHENREPCQWANHLLNSSRLIYVKQNVVRIFGWKSLEKLTSLLGIQLSADIRPNMAPRFIKPVFNNSFLATMYSEIDHPLPKSTLILWIFSDLTPANTITSIVPVPAYIWLSSKPTYFIDTAGTGSSEQLIFLYKGNWVCTVDAVSGKAGCVSNYFFFPTDWLSIANHLDLMIEVTKKGDVLFVKRDEVAVIGRSLAKFELEEQIQARAGSAPRRTCDK